MSHLTMTPEQLAAIAADIKARSRKVEPSKGGTGGLEGRGAALKRGIAQKMLKPLSTEELLASQLAAIGIKLEREFRWLPGRKYRADFACPEKKLLFEIDGAVHRINDKFHRDIIKRQTAILEGFVMFPLSTAQVRDGSALTLIERVLAMK